MVDVSVYSLNARGLSNEKKRKELFNVLRNSDGNIICLQETHSTLEAEQRWKMQWHSDIDFVHGTNNAQGVCILYSNKKINCNQP